MNGGDIARELVPTRTAADRAGGKCEKGAPLIGVRYNSLITFRNSNVRISAFWRILKSIT